MHRWKTLRRKRPKPSLPWLTRAQSLKPRPPGCTQHRSWMEGGEKALFHRAELRAASDPDSKGIKSPSRESGSKGSRQRTKGLTGSIKRLKHNITRMGHRAECQGICTLLKWFMSQKKPDQGALISSTSQVQNRKCLQSWQGRVVGVAHDIKRFLPLPLDLRWRLLIKNLDSVCYLTRGFVSPRCSTVSQEGIIFGAEKSLKDKNVLKLNIFPINQLRTV